MTTSPKRPGVAFWATVVVVGLPVGYPLSFGPACWLAINGAIPPHFRQPLYRLYEPLVNHALDGEFWTARALWWWGGAGCDGNGVLDLWMYRDQQ